MSSWELLDEKDEQELHKSRLLNVEEKPFKRITKRLHILDALARERPTQQPTPPAEGSGDGDEEEGASDRRDATAAQVRELEQLKEDLTLDFAAFNSSITRLQLLLNANARERDRYKETRQRILDQSDAVRANNSQLRAQLDEARTRLAQRKKFDELAERITSNRMLRPREDQQAALRKLDDECRELELESARYGETWRERRDQFARIMEEGTLLRRLIRDEKEEVERREGMNEDGEEDGEASRGGQTPKHVPSGNATPRPDSGAASRADGGDHGGSTPRPMTQSGARTPIRDSQDGIEGLKPRPEGHGGLSQFGSRAASRDVSPQPKGADDDDIEDGEDVEMGELVTPTRAVNGDAPQITIDAPESGGDRMEVDNS